MARYITKSKTTVQESDEESIQETGSSTTDPPSQITAAPPNQVTAARDIDDSPTIELSFVLEIFSYSEMQKKAKDRASKSTRFTLASDEPFDTFKAQLLAKISDLLKPVILRFEDYSITYMIKRKQKQTALQNEDDYHFLLSLHSISDIHVTVIQNRKPSTKVAQTAKQTKGRGEDGSESSEPSSAEDSDEPAQKKKRIDNGKSKKVRKIGDISPENRVIAETITQLKDSWRCNDRQCKGGTGHCWVHADGGIHIPLGHAHFNLWASAIARGDDTASFERPPNHHLFDDIPESKKSAMSPLLKARIDAKTKVKEEPGAHIATNANGIPSVVFNMPAFPQFPYQLSHFPAQDSISGEKQQQQQQQQQQQSNQFVDSLIPIHLRSGPDMSLAEFCTTYHLDEQVLKKFTDEGYRTTSSFQYISISDLSQAHFRRGDIAELKAAVSKWASPIE